MTLERVAATPAAGIPVIMAPMSTDIPWAAVAPLIAVAVAFVGYCLYDISRSDVRYLPKWAWALICVVSIPLGGIAYLLLGREQR
jgi:hypothetical protein